ncbi:MAG: hypothetical protein WBA74_22990 [Cyclobacteriaceae bacterium]
MILTSNNFSIIQKRIDSYPYAQIYARLIQNAENYVGGKIFTLKNSNKVDNLFIIQNILLEVSLAYVLTKNKTYKSCIMSTVDALINGQWYVKHFCKELHLGYLLSGLVVAKDIFVNFLSIRLSEAEIFERVIKEVADRLYLDSQTKNWGRLESGFNAWNHSAIPSSALALAGVLCPDLEGASTWKAFGKKKCLNFWMMELQMLV